MAKKKKSNEDQPEENQGNLNQNDSDDTFGLPDIDYKPLDRKEETSQPVDQTEQTTEQPEQTRYEYEEKPIEKKNEYVYVPPEEESPLWPKVLGILLVIALALGAVYYFIWYKPAQDEKARLAKEKIEREAREKERLAEEQRLRDEAERLRADSLANIPKVGVVETLTERTGRYYVVVASAIDDDLLMDYANKLKDTGISSKIIPPFGKSKFFRLTVADGDTFAAAQDVANSKKSEYGENTWVLKY